MIKIHSTADIETLSETIEVECKLAAGKDGKGVLPKDFWESYSAFANSYGGEIFLGIGEKDRHFSLKGLEEPQKVIEDLWSLLNNRQKVSANLLNHRFVQTLSVEGKSIVHVHVPRAPRTMRPVYIGGNPLTGTYKRQNSGDFRCDEETVRRMLAEQVEDSRDNEILRHYGIEDLSLSSLNAYRNLFASRSPDHPWNQMEPLLFLRNIGGWQLDREAGQGALTRAGLLMFGMLPSIQEVFPNYMLDYQERPEARKEARWKDRLTLDGAWSGNLFDFYRKVILKLTSDLKVPFALKGGERQDDTPVHQALREALVNAIVHADFTGRASLLVVKRPDMFGFRNPGLMRVPLEIALRGGESDCRNRTLHKMFRLIGLGEQAGSGIPKIYQSWKRQHWRVPVLHEREAPSEQTLLELHMLSLVPESALQYLGASLGEKFDLLGDEERLILVTAFVEQTVDHRRMMDILNIHPHDLTQLFATLTAAGLLQQSGVGRGTIYFLPEIGRKDDIDVMFGESSGPLEQRSGPLAPSSGPLDIMASIAAPATEKKKLPKKEMEQIILDLCGHQPLSLEQLEQILNRSGEFLRKSYLQPLMRAKKLKYRYPTKPNHPEQAYLAVKDEGNG